MIRYSRLSFVEREEISRQIANNQSIRSIARQLGRSGGTISREIIRTGNNKLDYRAIKAQKFSYKQRHKSTGKRKLEVNRPLREFVFYYLTQKFWTPEQIAKRLKIVYPNDMDMHLSHETIYSYVYILPRSTLKKELTSALRRKHTNRRPRKARQKTAPIQDYLSIEERPAEVADRIVPGHWEGDLLMGAMNKSAIGTLVERTTRFTFLVKLDNKDATTVRESFAEEFRHLPKELKRTLTYDQGQEMAEHKLFTKDTAITVFFAHPHSPWERGTNENTNALIRQFFPKGTDFNRISKEQLKDVQESLNDRPRKVHDFYTPNEVFYKLLH
jgi:IS30 family transposase